MAEHLEMPTLVLGVGQFSWMKLNALQVQGSYWSAPVFQSCPTTATILMMLVWLVKVSPFRCNA